MSGWWTRLALAALVVLAGGCNDEEDPGSGCAADGDCSRGEICEDGACSIIQCNGLGNCPGSGRTCLLDLRQCSPKECADVLGGVDLACPPERAICIDEGAFRASCVADVPCVGAEDCAPLGPGFACCGGQCSAECPDMGMLPVEDMGVTPPDGGGRQDMGGPAPDMGPPPAGGGLCAPCGAPEDCAELGEGARCQALGPDGAFCASPCNGPGDCPNGFQCLQDGLNVCVPSNFRCVECLRTPCPAGSVCDVDTGECTDPSGPCGACGGDADCQEGLRCGALGPQQHCFEACNGELCPEGFMCDAGLCKPASGQCDACGGTCGGATPYCNPQSGQCGACGPGFPCPDGLSCELATSSCVEREGCLADIDCQNPDLRVCFNGQCVACLQDTDCPPRTACVDQACVPDPCRGVICQRGSECNEETGRCDPGCNVDADCVDNIAMPPRPMMCAAATGQCYYVNGSCDTGQPDGVCAPGSVCTPSFLDPNVGVCDCELEDPMNPMSAQRRACHAGQACLQFLPDAPGCCGGCGIF